MATLTNKHINNGVLIYDRGDYPEGKLVLEEGITVAQGDLILLRGRYTSEGVTQVVTDTDGYTVVGTKQFKDDDATFQDDLAVNDVLWIKEGVHTGFYTVVSIDSQTQVTTDAAANFTSTTSLTYEFWTATIFKGRITDSNFEKIKTVLVEDECESDIDKPIEAAFYCGRLGGLIQELLDNEMAYINHEYTQSSPYNFRAPHNFRNTANGTWTPTDYFNNSQTTAGGTLTIVASVGDHKKVLQMYEPSGGDYAQIGKDDLNRHYDDVELYVRFGQTNQAHEIRWDDDDGTAQIPDGAKTSFSGIRIKFDNDGNIKKLTGRYTNDSWTTIQAYSANVWYKIRVKYDINNSDAQGDLTHDWHLWIDEVEKSPGGGWEFYGVDGGYDDMQGKKMENFYIYGKLGGGAQYAYFDAYGTEVDDDYIQGTNGTKEYDELIYTTDFFKYPMTEKTPRQYFNSYGLKHQKIWYLDPDYLIHIDDGDTDSLLDIDADSNVSNVDGKKQVKAIDKVVVKCGIVDGIRIIGTYGSGTVLAKDTHAHILSQADADAMALQIYNQQSAGILQVALDWEDPDIGLIQIGEEMTIVGNTITFKRSDTYICTTNTQFKLRSERLQLGPYGRILYNELYLDDVLLFQMPSQDETQKATEENSQLISEVGSGGGVSGAGGGVSGGESNVAANVGTGEGEVFKEKVGVTLYLKTLKQGSGIEITNNAEDVTLAVDPTPILENPPTEDLATKAPTSEWAFDHKANNVANIKHLTDIQLAALHARQHLIESVDDHSAVGLTTGHALRATGATTFAFGEIVSNLIYDGTLWNEITDIAPSKNAVRDVIETLVGAVYYQGTWNPASAYPATGIGYYYIVSADGYHAVDGNTPERWYELGDWIIWNASTTMWDFLRNSTGDNVLSVKPGDNIQTAIDEIESIGAGTVRLLPGTHILTTALTINNVNVDIVIEGFGDSSNIDVNGQYYAFNITDCASAVLRNFKIDATDYSTDSQECIYIDETNDNPVDIDKLTILFDGNLGVGIYVVSEDCSITNCKLSGGYEAIWIDEGHNCLVNGNNITDFDTFGIKYEADYCIISDNIIEGIIEQAIGQGHIASSYNIISNNNIYGGVSGNSEGISSSSPHNIIIGNTLVGMWNTSITCAGFAYQNVISSNTISGSETSGINAQSYRCTIIGNTISGIREDSIVNIGAIRVALDNNLVTGNVMYDNQNAGSGVCYGIIIASGTGNTIGPNVMIGNDSDTISDGGTGTIIFKAGGGSLDEAFDVGKIIDGANSEANSVQIGEATDKIKIWHDGSIGHVKTNAGPFYLDGATGVWVRYGGSSKFYFSATNFRPISANGYDLGANSQPWKTIFYHLLTDKTCADFSQYTMEELYLLFKVWQKRTDGILHFDEGTGKYYPHIDMATLPDEFGVLADEDHDISNMSKQVGETIESNHSISYKKGEKSGIAFNSVVYALKDLIVKQYEKIEELETRIVTLEQK